jgi:hypothetical protein
MTANARNITGAMARAPGNWLKAFWYGIQHYERGLGWDWHYDEWPIDGQLGYEQGRLLAAAARGAGTSCPAWDGSREGSWLVERFAQDIVSAHGAFLP